MWCKLKGLHNLAYRQQLTLVNINFQLYTSHEVRSPVSCVCSSSDRFATPTSSRRGISHVLYNVILHCSFECAWIAKKKAYWQYMKWQWHAVEIPFDESRAHTEELIVILLCYSRFYNICSQLPSLYFWFQAAHQPEKATPSTVHIISIVTVELFVAQRKIFCKHGIHLSNCKEWQISSLLYHNIYSPVLFCFVLD